MNYFKLNGDVIEKYEVIFNKAKLLKLKEEIIRNDCLVLKREFQGSSFWLTKVNKTSEIRNVKSLGLVRVRENMGGCDTAIYLYEYEEYFYSPEVLFINRLLEEDASVIEEIYSDFTPQKRKYEQQIEELKRKIDKVSNLETQKKINLLQELETLMELVAKIPNPYLLKIQSLIKLKLVDTISLKRVEEVSAFWQQEFNLEKINQRILKKEN